MPGYTLTEMAAETGLSPRTVRYYIAQGLAPAPGRQGSGTRYPRSTLDRLRLAARLRDANVPLAEIRRQLSGLSDPEVADLVGETGPGSNVEAFAGAQRAMGSPHSWLRRLEGPTFFGDLVPGEERILELRAPSRELRSHPARLSRKALFAESTFPPDATAGRRFGERSQWERIAISQDIELHVRRPLSPRDNRLVSRLVELAGRSVEAAP